jgi:hypothetical protein
VPAAILFSRALRQEVDVQHGAAHDMRRMNSDSPVHGFRSAFRDWASERTNFAREICEAALAYIIKDNTEAAYRRGDLFESTAN